MGGRARRGLAIASATWVLAGAGCRGDDHPPSGATEGEVSSSGVELDASGSTAEPVSGACMPGASRACYDGPPGTDGLGVCTAGQQVCTADGRGWSECTGQVWPEPAERCDTPQDDDCDGLTLCEPALEWWQPFSGYVAHVAAGEAGGVVVAGFGAYGRFQGEALEGMFVVGLDASGQLSWARSVGNEFSYPMPAALEVDPSGDIVIAGSYDGAPDLGGGPLPGSFGAGAFAVRYTASGEHVWSYAFESQGYFDIAIGPDGATYLVGGYVIDDWDGELAQATMHVTALDPEGVPSWVLPGEGPWTSDSSLVFTDAGELVLVAVAQGHDLTVGDLPTPTMQPPIGGSEPLAVRIGLDGTPLGYRRLVDSVPLAAYDITAFTRPGGLMTVCTVEQELEGSYVRGVRMMGLDTALELVSQRFVDDHTWLEHAAPHPDGSTVLAITLTGAVLELGPIGVGGGSGVVVAVDDEGQGRWAEVLYSENSATLRAVATAPDGAVLVSGWVDGSAVLAGVEVSGSFVAKLRP